MPNKITQARLKELLFYDELSGLFTWRIRPSNFIQIGDIVGTLRDDGYIRITLCSSRYYAHRLAWLYVTGSFPECHLDHIDGVKVNNAFVNLRECTVHENMLNRVVQYNSKTGVKGVYPKAGKYAAKATFKGVRYYLGTYSTILEASNVYEAFCNEHHGEFKLNRS